MGEKDNIGQVVRQIREGAHLTQDSLAEAIGSTQAALSNVEIGRMAPSWEFILKLSSVLPEGNTDVLVASMKSCSPTNRRNDLLRALRSATAILKGFSKLDQTPPDIKYLLSDFLPLWEEKLDDLQEPRTDRISDRF